MKTPLLLILIACKIFPVHLTWNKTIAEPGVLTVCPEGPPVCDYAIVQDAVDAAASGTTIKVAAGTYSEVKCSDPYQGCCAVVCISDKALTLRGGYTTTFQEPSDPQVNVTTLDAHQAGSVLAILASGTTVEGFRITGGQQTEQGLPACGIFLSGLLGDAITLKNNVITGNFCSGPRSIPSALWVDTAWTVILEGNKIVGNDSPYGGSVYVDWVETLVLTNNIFADNVGPELQIDYAESSLLTNNTFAQSPDSPRGPEEDGIVIEDHYVTAVFTNTIIVGQRNGVISHDKVQVWMEATLWGAGDWANERDADAGWRLFTGDLNYWLEPGFVNPGLDDFRLTKLSGAKDRGIASGLTIDYEGQSRPCGSSVDIGADEYCPYLQYLPTITRR